MNILTNIPSLAFSSQLHELHIVDVEQVVSFSIMLANETLFEETFVPDTKGEVVISGVNKIIDAELLENPLQNFIFRFETDKVTETKEARILLSKAEMGVEARSFMHQRYLTTLVGDKETLASSHEYLYVYPLKATSYKVQATYRDIDSGEYDQFVHNGENLIVNKINALDVSPSKYARAGKLLVKYIVVCGYREMTYYVDHLHKTTDLEIIFSNNFGLAETFATKGTLLSEDIYNNQFGTIRGNYKKLQTDKLIEYTSNTGVMSQEIATWLAENLFSSLDVFRIESRKIGKKITITDQTIKRSSDCTELPSYEFKYRLEQSIQSVYQFSKLLRSVWDKTFDKTFRGNDTYK